MASLTLHETRSIHDSMNIPKIEFISSNATGERFYAADSSWTLAQHSTFSVFFLKEKMLIVH